jgi:hypothetical protein
MVSGLVSLWLAAALGQTPAAAEPAWLKSVPAEADVVVRVRGLQTAHDDLAQMLEAMSPNLSALAKPIFEQGLSHVEQAFGKDVSNAPFVAMMRLPKPGAMGSPPYAVLLKSSDYSGIQKQLAGPQGDAKPKPQGGGIDTIKGPDGLPIYTYKGTGLVAFSNDELTIGLIARPKSTLDAALGAGLKSRLLGGDLGIYVNLAAIQKQYGDQIDQLRQQGEAAVANQPQATSPEITKTLKSMYGAAFDAFKDAEGLALNFDFARDGLTLAGEATVKKGTSTAKFLKTPKTAAGEVLASLPSDLTSYLFFNANPATIEKIQSWSMQFMTGPGESPSPDLKKALDLQREAGVKDMAVASGLGSKGPRGVSIATYADPKKAVEATAAMTRAAKTSKSPYAAVIKSVEVKPNDQNYRSFSLTRSQITFDPSKFGELQPNVPNSANMLKAMMGDSVNTWFGTDGKVFLSVVAPDWDKAKTELDAVLTGAGSLGKTSSYRSIRAKLPAQVNGLLLISAQGLVEQIATQLSAVQPKADVKPAGDLPKEPALIGVAAVNTADGIQFQTVIPSAVGPVVEKGMVPILQGASGKINQ